MQPWFGPSVEKSSSSLVDANVAVVNDMEASGEVEHEDEED